MPPIVTPGPDAPAGRPASAIELHQVGFSHVKGAPPFLRCGELNIPAGTATWLSGQSGSGKSTLLRLAAGIHRAAHGVVRVDGTDLTTASDAARAGLRARRMGVVFQDHDLLEGLSIRENVQFTAQLAGRRLAREDVVPYLELVGIADLADRTGPEVSGGQRQRAAIARAIAKQPALMCLDEPTSALDEANARAMFGLLRQMVDRGMTALVVSHDPGVADFCDHRVDVTDGLVGPLVPLGRG